SYLVNRTVNNIALDDDWDAILAADAAATIAQVGVSTDAVYNPTSPAPHSNGPGKLDGKLKWGSSDETTPRGLPADTNVGQTAIVDLPADMSTITIIVTISDVGDKIYDSVGAIDWFAFK
ncbi:MAG: hypothetical protein KJ042_06875, partial [Deltaproteobacteria bacterium]|nr:hypothetical protein [Deltaproteobacteria bacterium]